MRSIGSDCLYLVTDSGLLNSQAESLEAHVEQAIEGGVSVVQLREKHANTRDIIDKARKLLAVCRKYRVPLIINDRVDVAMAVGADGVHVGQDDMSCVDARALLGPECIIGVSVNTVEEAEKAVKDGADYLGIGAVYDTSTKALTNPTLGTSGVQVILQHLATLDRTVETVAIGGINASNIDRVLFASATETRKLNGIALVSAIMASSDPKSIAAGLKRLMTSRPAFAPEQSSMSIESADVDALFETITKVRVKCPLIHQMTNNVVKNFSANVTIAIGASPVMSEVREEAEDLAKVNGAFLLNMGMVAGIDIPVYAAQMNNTHGKPTLLDPVGAGGTSFRRQATKTYLDSAYFDVIKGNESEIRAAAGLTSDQKGVDNVSVGDTSARTSLARDLANRHKNIVVVTGVEDVVSDGRQTVLIKSGHRWLGEITGSGCSLGSVIASFLAVTPNCKLLGVICAVLLYGMAAEHAAHQDSIQGPGSFIPAFCDALYLLSTDRAVYEKQYNFVKARLQVMA